MWSTSYTHTPVKMWYTSYTHTPVEMWYTSYTHAPVEMWYTSYTHTSGDVIHKLYTTQTAAEMGYTKIAQWTGKHEWSCDTQINIRPPLWPYDPHCDPLWPGLTLHALSRSEMVRLPRLAATMASSWRHELPAATAFAVATVIGLVTRISSSTVIFCSTCSVARYVWNEDETPWGTGRTQRRRCEERGRTQRRRREEWGLYTGTHYFANGRNRHNNRNLA